MFQQSIDLLLQTNIVWYLLLNLISVTLFSLGIYFKRYYDREAVITCVLFNLFVFSVVTAFLNVSSDISAGFGFGLFAILSLITLRSETLSRTTITFFFGSLSIALINALGLDNGALVIFLNAIILLAAWIVDHPDLLSGVQNMKLVLDHIPAGILEHSSSAIKDLSDTLHVEVITYTVINIDQVKDTVKLEVAYKRA